MMRRPALVLVLDPDQQATVRQRFEKFVRREGEHELWTGWRNKRGVGWFYLDGQLRTAAVVAWLLAGRSLPPGRRVRRTCGAGHCVRADHLTILSRRRGGRWPLDPAAIAAMRQLRGQGVRLREIAQRFRVCEATASLVVRGGEAGTTDAERGRALRP